MQKAITYVFFILTTPNLLVKILNIEKVKYTQYVNFHSFGVKVSPNHEAPFLLLFRITTHKIQALLPTSE
jgi:hypothetical protein